MTHSSAKAADINHDSNSRNAAKELVAGAISGTIAAILTAPLDLAKTRMQVEYTPKSSHTLAGKSIPRYTNLSGTLQRTLAEEGIRGWFKGLGSTVLGLAPNWAIYFATYGRAKHMLQTSLMKESSSDTLHLASAVVAGLFTTCVTNPLWLVKVRMQTQFKSRKPGELRYEGIPHAFKKIFREEGLRGFYRGLPASLLGVAHVAIQFPLYERLKHVFQQTGCENELDFKSVIYASAISKLIASTLTYPHEVVRTRFQRQSRTIRYTGLIQSIRKIYHEEGMKAFFSGLNANLLRVVPACAVTFVTFEYTLEFLNMTL